MISFDDRLSGLETRITLLEQRHHDSQDIVVDDSMRRARLAVEKAAIYSAHWKFVPEPYYTWPLSERAICLGAPSVHHLCKSLLLDNKKVHGSAMYDPTYPKYVLVVLQYAATLDAKALVNAIRALRPVKERYDDSRFDFRIASEEDNDRLTGYRYNSVTPFGLAKPDEICLVLSQAVVPRQFIWMGGGHVHLKLGVTVSDFCRALNPIVASISQPRTSYEECDDGPSKVSA